jgi:hypothetical protein
MNEILLVNPSRRRRKSKGRKRSRVRLKRHAATRRRRSRVKAVRRYKRNPSGRSFSLSSIGGAIVPTIKSGALGAVGAIANDAFLGQVGRFLPAVLQSGYARHGVKLVSAVVVGALGNLALKGKGSALAVGAATVAMHGLIRETINANFPSATPFLGDFDDLGAYSPGLIVDGSAGMGEYIPGVGDMGEYIPGVNGYEDGSDGM